MAFRAPVSKIEAPATGGGKFDRLLSMFSDPTSGALIGGPMAVLARGAKVIADPALALFRANPTMAHVGQEAIPLDKLILEHSVSSPRAQASVDRYTKAFQSGADVPSLVVQRTPEGKFQVMSGNARTEAARRLGLPQLTADIFEPRTSRIVPPSGIRRWNP